MRQYVKPQILFQVRIIACDSVEVPEGYEKCLRVSSEVRENPYVHLLAEKSGNAVETNLGGGANKSWGKTFPLTKCQRPSRMSDERVEFRATFCT